MVDMHLYTFAQIFECTTPRVNSNVNYGFGVLCVSIGSSFVANIPLLWGMLVMRKAMHIYGYEIYRDFQYILLNFAVFLKLL